ncbi:hypothetical protein L3X38_023411 [Prunus dulcis]|uniref:Uncharacterized protein n=1 Tax=Prunus dulcis TaxID=3755 RepID=A0AAD4Z583_PRUDU|nr:hypothetical protein L3X38_023411 [Prunus dulcis]
MGAPNIWMLGLTLRWTIFKYWNIGNSANIPPAKLQLPQPDFACPSVERRAPRICPATFARICPTTFAKGSARPYF